MKKHILFPIALLACSHMITAQSDDNYQWLEEVENKKALEFVDQRNKATIDKLSQQKEYQGIYDKSLEIYNSADRIVYPALYGDFVYNFWQDKEHERGIWRRSPRAAYNSGNPVWETLLDLDELSKKDNVKWVYKGGDGLYPDYKRFIINLSKGGGDAVVCREFDVNSKTFIENK